MSQYNMSLHDQTALTTNDTKVFELVKIVASNNW